MIPKIIQEKKQEIITYVKGLGVPIVTPDQEENLIVAFTHKSFSADVKNTIQNNERLEFVGDGILWATINKLLFLDYPAMDESELTLYKIALVRQETLAEVARDIKLDKYLFISKGEEKMHWREKDAILSDGLEALIWYIYLWIGEEETRIFVEKYVYCKVTEIQKWPVKSYKTMVQELVQKEHKVTPEYKEIEEKVDEKGNVEEYRSEIYVVGEKMAEWSWSNKKKAQEAAAKKLYEKIISKE